jgi:drug/metabolite transporter (DMT)-like permease
MNDTYLAGALYAALAGVGFGIFQAFNRKARAGFSIYWATFILLLVSTVLLAVGSILTEDLSLLQQAPANAFINFGLAGFIHFFLGWTLLTISQNRVGGARTGALVGATPLFATLVAALAFDEFLSIPVLVGVVIVVAGVYFVSVSSKNAANPVRFSWRDSIYGLGVAVCFSISPIFIRGGLDEMNSPLLGVTIGMAMSAIAYGILLLLRRERLDLKQIPRESLYYQLGAGLFVGSSTWLRWIALTMTPVAVVLALGRMNVPVVIILSIFLVGQKEERVTSRVWLGATLVVVGSLMLIFAR